MEFNLNTPQARMCTCAGACTVYTCTHKVKGISKTLFTNCKRVTRKSTEKRAQTGILVLGKWRQDCQEGPAWVTRPKQWPTLVTSTPETRHLSLSVCTFEASLAYKVDCRPPGRLQRFCLKKKAATHLLAGVVAHTFDLHTSKKEVITDWGIPP